MTANTDYITDTRTVDQLGRDIALYDALIPIARQTLNEAQRRLDRFERERDHTKERLWVLKHTYAQQPQTSPPSELD